METVRVSKTHLKSIVKSIVFLAVMAGVAITIRNAFREIDKEQYDITQIKVGWLVVAGAAYLAGLVPCWIFWHATLRAMQQQPRWLDSFRAFFISHLGKYVPGKAMVVVLRTAWIRGDRVDTTVAATSVFVETLTMMAVGAFVSAMILITRYHHQVFFVILALALMCCAGIPTLPPIFKRIVRMLQLKKTSSAIDPALDGLTMPLMVSGWLTISLGWLLLGTSLFFVLKALPGIVVKLDMIPLLTACVALSMVAGFLSMIPGGVGVRELVIIPLLGELGEVGPVNAVLAAILLRLVWLAAESLISSMLYGWSWLCRAPANSTAV